MSSWVRQLTPTAGSGEGIALVSWACGVWSSSWTRCPLCFPRWRHNDSAMPSKAISREGTADAPRFSPPQCHKHGCPVCLPSIAPVTPESRCISGCVQGRSLCDTQRPGPSCPLCLLCCVRASVDYWLTPASAEPHHEWIRISWPGVQSCLVHSGTCPLCNVPTLRFTPFAP